MRIAYTHLANVDTFRNPRLYEPGDRLVGYTRLVEVAGGETSIVVAERLCELHGGPDGFEFWRFPPIEAGDVLMIGDDALGVSESGVAPTDFDAVDVVSEADWVAFMSALLVRPVRRAALRRRHSSSITRARSRRRRNA
jgi:hypothetical protein